MIKTDCLLFTRSPCSPVQVLEMGHSIENAIGKFKHFSFEEFPIIDSKHKLVGSLSRKKFYEQLIISSVNQEDIHSKLIKDIFLDHNSCVYSAEPVTDIRRVASLMLEKKLHAVPILESTGSVLGVVTRTDIIRAIITDPPLSLWC